MLPENEVRNHQSLYYLLLACLCLILCLFSILAPCDVALDLYLAIDSTKTLGQNGHNTMKTWAERLVDLFNIGTTASSGVTRVEVIQFWGSRSSFRYPDSHAEVDIGLGVYTDKDDLKEKIKGLTYNRGESTIIPHGLSLLSSEITKYQRPPRKTYVLVLTDGVDDTRLDKYQDPPAGSLQQEAKELKEKDYVTVFAIGFQGTNFDEKMNVTNLQTIASSNNNVIHDQNLGVALNKTYNRLIQDLCPSNSNIPMLPTALGEFNWCIEK